MEERKENNLLYKLLGIMFSIKKERLILVSIVFLGLILRLIAGINLNVAADDMHHSLHAINFLKTGRLITYDQSAGLWHSFTSVIYDFFGVNQFTSRFASILFGSLSIFVIYYLSKEFFDENISLFSAFLFSISPFLIRNMISEMDTMAMFFVLASMLFFIRSNRLNNYKECLISGISMGLAIYTKVYPLLFIPSLILFFVYEKSKKSDKIIVKRSIKFILIFLLSAFIFTIPVLTHNYLLYKDKGFLDLQFTRTLNLGRNNSAQYYSWDPIWDRTNSWKGLIFGDSKHGPPGRPLIVHVASFIFYGSTLNFILGIIGIFLIKFKSMKYKRYNMFFIFSILFVYPFLGSIILLNKHFIFLEMFLIPPAALTLNSIYKKCKVKYGKDIIRYILIFSFIMFLFIVSIPKGGMPHFFGKSDVAQIINFKNNNVLQDSLIIGDSRIYRGKINWMFHGRSYLEGIEFMQYLNKQDDLPGIIKTYNVYYFECVLDDCGWGTIKNQPEFNQSMEELSKFFIQNGDFIKEFKEPERGKIYLPLLLGNKIVTTKVYHSKLNLKSSIIDIAKKPKNWFLYDIGYEPKEKQFDYYQTHSFFDTSLDKIAHWIVLIATIIAFLSPIYVIYFVFKDEKIINNNPSL